MTFDESAHPRVGKGSPEGGQFGGAGQTSSPEFKKWFGESKVVDDKGEPLVVYHGTHKQFGAFSSSHIGKRGVAGGEGFYFAEDPNVASYYAPRGTGEDESSDALEAQVYPVYLRIKNMLWLGHTTQEQAEDAAAYLVNTGIVEEEQTERIVDAMQGGARALWETFGESFGTAVDALVNEGPWDGIKFLEAHGTQGETPDWVYVVYKPTQIKSATGNRGTFDPQNPDIRMSRTRSGQAVLRIADEWGLQPASVAEAAKEVYSRHVREIASGRREGPYPAFYDRSVLGQAAAVVFSRDRVLRSYYGASSTADVERFWRGETREIITIEDGQPMRYWQSGGAFSAEKYAKDFVESEHPRDDEGKFSETEGEPAKSPPAAKKRTVQPVHPTEITSVLSKMGLQGSIRRQRDPISGYKVSRMGKKQAFMVAWEDWGDVSEDFLGQSEKMEVALKEAGFVVTRPFPDKNLLGVYRVTE